MAPLRAVCGCLLLLSKGVGSFLVAPAAAPVAPARHARRRAARMQLSRDIIDNTNAGRHQEASFKDSRPEWFRELLMVKEKGILRGEYELLRIDWGKEDDQVVDELLVGGKVAEAQQYFEQKKAMSVPIYRQTLRYHWTQSDTEIFVGVPVPRAVRGASLHLIVSEEALQMALIDDPAFGVVSGKFPGEIDAATSGWQLVQRPDGSYSVSMTLKKIAQPGTHSLWYSLFQGEKAGTCMQFKGRTPRYHWSQDLDYVNAAFPVPEGVRGKSVELVIDAAGSSMRLSYPIEPGSEDRVTIDEQFCGVVSPEECSWVIDEDEEGTRCICLSLRKRRRDTADASWWARLFKIEEDELPEELKALEQAQMERGLSSGQDDGWDAELDA